MYCGLPLGSLHVMLHKFMPYIVHKSCKPIHCAKVGGGMDQGPATQVTHLSQPSSSCSE